MTELQPMQKVYHLSEAAYYPSMPHIADGMYTGIYIVTVAVVGGIDDWAAYRATVPIEAFKKNKQFWIDKVADRGQKITQDEANRIFEWHDIITLRYRY